MSPSSRPGRAPRLLRRGGVAVAAAPLLVLGACSGGSGGGAGTDAGAAAAASAFATALASGDLSAVSFTSGNPATVQADYHDVVDGMGEVTPGVALGAVSGGDGATASATLHWSWPLSDTVTWTYDSTVALQRAGDGWRVVWGHRDVEPSLSAASVLSLSSVTPQRGEILGAHRAPIVVDRAVVDVGIDRNQVPAKQAEASARALAALVGVDADSFARTVASSGPEQFVPAITYRQGDLPGQVSRGVHGIRGARLVTGQRPLAPTREFAAPLLGTVGPVTAEMIKDHPDTYRAGDVAGLSGLEARYDEQLRGTPGLRVEALASDGRSRTLYTTAATDGTPLRLTLDPRLETLAERLLAGVGPASALVAIKPSTGAVLAAANGPGNGGQNFATFGQYAPGSTFKAVSSLALLRSGLTPSSTVTCSPSLDVDGKQFTNYSDYPSSAIGRIPFSAAIANSCNTAVISQAGRLGPDDLVAAAASLGFGVDHEVGYPAFFGSVGKPASATEKAADLIGQGTVLASPLAMATVVASIQRGGVVVPRLVEGVDGLDTAPPSGITPLSGTESSQLRSLLRGVVTQGSGRLLATLPGPPVIAKTGTAEFDGTGGIQTHAWMIAAQGDLAVAVFVDLGSSGSGTAGPILRSFLTAAR